MKTNQSVTLFEQLSDAELFSTAENAFLEYQALITKYNCAIREVRTKFEVLNDELSIKSNRNPIHAIHSRIKEPRSIMKKLERKELPFSLQNVRENVNDVAGIRVICNFVDDIYKIADMLLQQDDITLIRCKDYISNPKPNGYRSYHILVEIPVFFSDGKELMKVEIQLRTIAMDFWASLEHELKYKKNLAPENNTIIGVRLLECANTIAEMDFKMQDIKNQIFDETQE